MIRPPSLAGTKALGLCRGLLGLLLCWSCREPLAGLSAASSPWGWLREEPFALCHKACVLVQISEACVAEQRRIQEAQCTVRPGREHPGPGVRAPGVNTPPPSRKHLTAGDAHSPAGTEQSARGAHLHAGQDQPHQPRKRIRNSFTCSTMSVGI